MRETADVVIVGGGVAGLAAAHRIATTAPAGFRHMVIEADVVAGGKILSVDVAGRRVDVGAEGILDCEPVRELLEELGVGSAVVQAGGEQPGIWMRSGIHRIPDGLVGGVPTKPLQAVRTRLLSPLGAARVAAGGVLPRRAVTRGDVALGTVLRKRFGDEVVDRIVGPLIGGINAGDVDRLSAEAMAPAIFTALQQGGTFIRALRGAGLSRPGGGLIRPRGGVGVVVDALVRELGPRLRLGSPATAVRRDGATWIVHAGDLEVRSGHLILATPAAVTARLLGEASPGVAAELDGVGSASVAVVVLGYRREDLADVRSTRGFVVPRDEGLLVTAVTHMATKWRDLADGHTALLRCSVGRDGDERWQTMSDSAIVGAVVNDLRRLIGLEAVPTAAHVHRWPGALPQYRVGHRARVAHVRTLLGPTCRLLGASYDGVGVASCITTARDIADEVVARTTSAHLVAST